MTNMSSDPDKHDDRSRSSRTTHKDEVAPHFHHEKTSRYDRQQDEILYETTLHALHNVLVVMTAEGIFDSVVVDVDSAGMPRATSGGTS